MMFAHLELDARYFWHQRAAPVDQIISTCQYHQQQKMLEQIISSTHPYFFGWILDIIEHPHRKKRQYNYVIEYSTYSIECFLLGNPF